MAKSTGDVGMDIIDQMRDEKLSEINECYYPAACRLFEIIDRAFHFESCMPDASELFEIVDAFNKTVEYRVGDDDFLVAVKCALTETLCKKD